MEILDCRSIKEKEKLKLKEAINKEIKLVIIQIGNFKENDLY